MEIFPNLISGVTFVRGGSTEERVERREERGEREKGRVREGMAIHSLRRESKGCWRAMSHSALSICRVCYWGYESITYFTS